MRRQRAESAEREERHGGNATGCEFVDEGVVAAMREVVMVLDAHDIDEAASFFELIA